MPAVTKCRREVRRNCVGQASHGAGESAAPPSV